MKKVFQLRNKSLCLEIIKQNGLNLKFINLSQFTDIDFIEKLYIAAIKQNISALQFFDIKFMRRKFIEDLYLDIVKKNELNKKFIKNLYFTAIDENVLDVKDLYLFAIKKNGLAIKYIDSKFQFTNEEFCYMAVRRHREAILYIIDQTEEICLVALRRMVWL